jgi:hypothetical protein
MELFDNALLRKTRRASPAIVKPPKTNTIRSISTFYYFTAPLAAVLSLITAVGALG